MKNNSDNRINVDKANYSVVASFKQEDDAVLTVELYKNGVEFDVSEQEVSLAAIREDKVIIEQLDEFNINKNRVTINLKNNILEVPGIVLCELSIVDSQGAMTTTDFKIKVNKKILTVDAIDANDIETINSIKKEEAIRVESENTRKSNEEVRKSNEINRINKENERNSSEEVRGANESTRNENEEIRKSQETERVNAENIRKSNEEIRKSNEFDRENRFDIVEANANSLIGEMQNTIDSNIGTEVIEARKDKEKLGLRLDDMETQSVENASSIEEILQELLKCLKSDGSVVITDHLRVTGDWKGIVLSNQNGDRGLIESIPSDAGDKPGINIGFGKKGESITNCMVLRENSIEFGATNKTSIGSKDRFLKDIFLGSVILNVNNGTCRLPNGYILQYGRIDVSFDNNRSFGKTLSYPTTFPNGVAVVGANMATDFSNASLFNTVATISNRSQISVRGYCVSGAVTQNAVVNWWAIGW